MKIDNFDLNDQTFIIAELSANHNQNLKYAIETIKEAKKCGANAIKLQTYTPDTMTIPCNNNYFTIKDGLWKGKTLYELYQRAFTPWEWHEELFKVAKEEGIICFSTPFDKTSVDFLEQFNPPAYKIASFEIQDIPLIKYAAKKNRPIILSTGIAALSDIELAVNSCKEAGNKEIILLKCTSSYPASLDEVNLKTIANLKETFQTEVGLSDHTLGISVPIAAVSLGAKVVEKHFILDKNIPSPDTAFSLDPSEFSLMVKSIREVEQALGDINYNISAKVEQNRIFSRSLFIVENVKEGEVLTEKNIRSIRPGFGLHTKYYDDVIGKKCARDIQKGEPLTWQMVNS